MNDRQSSKPKSSQKIGKKKHQVFSRHLLAGLAIAVVSIIGGGWVSFQWFGERITQNTQENLLAIADLKANQIERWVYERKGDARILAGRPSLADVLKAIETSRKDETTLRQWQVMQQAVRNTQREYNYKRIVLLNRFGRAVWSSDRDSEISAEVLASFKKIQDKIVTENAELVDLHWNDTKTGKAIDYGVIAPIYDNLNPYDPFLGAVYLEADPAEYLFPLIQSWPTSSTSAETLLVRQEGNLIRYLNPLRHQGNTPVALTRSSDDRNLLAAKAIRANEPLLTSLDYRRVPVIGAARFVKGTPWIMISKIDIAEADSPLHQLILAISGLMVLLIIISGVIFRQLSRSSKLSLLALEQQLALESAIEIEQNASRYVTAIETSIDGFALLDRHGRFLEVNTSLSSLTGYSRDELLNLSIFDLAVMGTTNPDSFMTDLIAKVCDRFNQQWKPKNRDILDVEIGITYLSQGEGQFFTFVRDITNALKLQRQLERSNRLHTFLSHANEAIVRTRDSQELLNRICEIAIADGGFRLAWVGIVNPDNQMVEVAAAAGEAIEYVKNIQISIDPTLPIAHGPTGTAIREKYPAIVNDFLADPRTVPWHAIALEHGIQSSATIPLRIDRETVGAIMFYASEVNYFADDVVALLNELAEDLAMALALVDSEKRREVAEKGIREQAFLFQSQFDAGVLGIAISSVQQQWLRVNRKLSEILGYSETELCGMSWVEMTYPQDLPANLEKFQRLIDGEIDGYELEKRFIRKDGSLVYTHMNVSCYRAEDRSVQFLVSSFQDITSRKQAERALQQSEERFRLAIINAPFPIIFYTKDNKVLEINRAWIDQAGYAESDIQEITAWTERFCLENLPSLNPQTAAWQTDERYEQEITITARDGSQRIWRFGSALLPYHFENNNFTAISMAIDVTEQRRAELELKLSEERFRRAIVNAPLPTIIHAEGGEILQLNQAWSEISGYSLEDIPTISAWVKKVYGENTSSVVLTAIEQIYEINDIRHEGEFTITVRDGSTRIWDFHSAPLGRIADGRRIIISMAIDVSDRKANELALQKAKELAEEANRAKSTFLANMSHELRTPLNGILGYAQIFLLDSGFTAKQKEGLQIIYQCGNHLLDLISEILDLSKIEAQKLELSPKRIEFSSFLIGVAQICRIKAVEKNLIFNYEVADTLPFSVLVDDQRLRQVLLNLLGNAIKFTDRGSVTMKVEAIEAWESKDLEPLESFNRSEISQPNSITKIRFEIADTGKGIASQNLEQIFQPFEQVGDRQNRPEGTGLGLAISQRLVTMMGGSLRVESQLNQGSRFWFDLELPEITATIAAQTRSIPASKKIDRVIGHRGQKRTILVVDDQWINRSVLSKMLESWGFKVLEAANGEQGIAMATSTSIDAIVTDLLMPVLDGYAMVQKLRELPTFQKLPIIAISASILPIEQIKSQEAGCTDFLPKPVDATALLDKLKQYLHLDWIYESLSGTRSPDIKSGQIPSDRKIPPVQELITIQEALEVGDFQAIEQEAERIKRLDPQYQWFSVRLVELTQSFDDKGILQLIN